ncbi:MAG TPA: Helicase associated domain protein, partial [Puia sp.]|nr:Helicase associated domain protein [Puia sp.]
MDLFPHNREAYECATNLFKTGNRACIIQPTGTGKSVVIAEFVNRNRSKRHLLLAPGSHIFDEIRKHLKSSKMSFSTYIGLKTNKSIFIENSFDFIYLDEFHRLGAEIWGGGIRRLLRCNPRAKVLGTSATPIRYLDDNRDMASEIFDGRIAIQMSLNSAIVKGILPSPTYVSAIYSLKEDLQLLKTKIASSRADNKKAILKDLNSKVIDWEKSSGLDTVIQKHIDPHRKRVIVFCKNWEHLRDAQTLLDPIFKPIYGDFRSLCLYSKNKNAENESALNIFRENHEFPIVLYAIDKINEGLHSKNCNTVILFRNTTSPIVFYQQIGRAFSIKPANGPLILDLVNNFRNLQIATFKSDFERELEIASKERQASGKSDKKTTIRFIDETQDIRQIFSLFEESIDNWTRLYAKAKLFFDQNGHLIVPAVGNMELYHWLNNQRKSYLAGSMSKERIAKFNEIGMIFTPPLPLTFLRMQQKMEQWMQQHAELPTQSTNKKLAMWISNQRKDYKQGKLTEEQIAILQRFFPMEGDRTWLKIQACIDKVVAHFKQGNIDTADKRIRMDLLNLRNLYNCDRLPQSALTQLREARVPVEVTINDFIWFENVKKILAWYEQNERLPSREDCQPLHSFWMREKRYINNSHPYAKYLDFDREAGSWLQKLQTTISAEDPCVWNEQYLALR